MVGRSEGLAAPDDYHVRRHHAADLVRSIRDGERYKCGVN